MTKVNEVLKFKDKGLSVEDARKAMIAAGEAPPGVPTRRDSVVAGAPDIEPEFVDNGEVVDAANPNAAAQAEELARQAVVVPPKPPIPANAAPVTPVTPAEKPERIETVQFVAEIRQESGGLVAEIKYKNGSGTEKFSANSKSELMLKLLEGKGHATLRVKEAVRREKLGGQKLDRAYSLPNNITAEQFAQMPDWQQNNLIETIATQQAILFREECPEYYKTDANGKALDDYLRKNDLPYTVRNLHYAFEDMVENDLFPDKRLEATSILTQPTPAAVVEDSAPVVPVAPAPANQPVPVAPAAPAETVRKRGFTSLPSGSSSAPSGAGAVPEDEANKKDLSEAELRKLPMDELRRIANADRRARATTR